MSHELLIKAIGLIEALTERVSDLEQANVLLQDRIDQRDIALRIEVRDELVPYLVGEAQQAVVSEIKNRQVVVNPDGTPDSTPELEERIKQIESRLGFIDSDIKSLFAFKGQHLLDHETNGGNVRELSPFEISKKLGILHSLSNPKNL